MTDHQLFWMALVLQAIETLLLIRIFWQGEFIMKYEKGIYEVHTKKEVQREEWREAKRRAVVKKLEYETALAEAKELEAVQEDKNGV